VGLNPTGAIGCHRLSIQGVIPMQFLLGHTAVQQAEAAVLRVWHYHVGGCVWSVKILMSVASSKVTSR